MSDSPPRSATTPTPDEPAMASANLPPDSPTASDKTIAAATQDRNVHQEFLPASGAAIFSTELCTRPPRSAPGPPYPPVIVRGGDKIKAVVDAAHYWQTRFKWQCLCIFPGQHWDIHDLWDAADIHVESSPFCKQMLTFIERDTYYAAMKFAEDWLRAHPDRQAFVGAEMMSIYDPHDPLAIVDKVFVYGELTGFPRTFLWHVAHMMRTSMANVSTAKNATKEASHVQESVHVVEDITKAALDIIATDNEAAIAADSSSTQTNRHIENSSKSSAVDTSIVTSAAPHQPAPRPNPKHVPSHAPPQHGYHTEHMSNNMASMTGPTMMPPIMPPQTKRVATGRPRNMGSGSYNQPLPPQGWSENFNRVPSGPYSRHASGTMSNMQSPHFIPATMAMGPPMMIPSNVISPYAQGSSMMPPPMGPNQHFDPGLAQRGIMPGQPMPMQTPIIGQAYLQQPHHGAGARGGSMGDMSNSIYYSNNVPIQQIDVRASMARQPNNFNNGGTLYDPYNGANPKFKDGAIYNGGKKSSQNSFATQPGRARKISNSGSRPGYGQHGADRPGNMPRYLDHGFRKGRSEDDPGITQNRSSGCHDNWIGPKNETVTELFVGDLPDDVQVHELKSLFEQQAGVSPSQVEIKHAHEQQQQQLQHRLHAFISFCSVSDAKKALQIRDRNPYLRDGSVAVAVSVPRRFFQKTLNSVRKGSLTSGSYVGPSYASQPDDRDGRGVARMSSHDEKSGVTNPSEAKDKPLYSPQDARSDLQKKPVRQSPGNDPASSGSPGARQSKRRQGSPTQEATTKREHTVEAQATVEVEAAGDSEVVDADRLSSLEAEATTAETEVQAAEEPVKSPIQPLSPARADPPAPEVPATLLTDTSRPVGDTAGPAGLASSQPLKHGKDPKSELGREVLQTESSLDSSLVETRTPVVNIPLKPANDVPEVEQSVTEAGKVQVEQSEYPAAGSHVISAEDAGSDDDLKNDISFHSARESQTEPPHVGPMPEHRDESIPVNHETKPAEFSSTEEPSKPDPFPSSQAPSEDTPLQDLQSQAIQSEQEATTESEAEAGLKDDTEAIEAPSVAAPTQHTVPMAATSSNPSVEALKKGGAQQIQSLSPFAKPSKAQQRKERELKKKQQKKEQAEKEARAKSEKATLSSKLKGSTTAEAGMEQPQVSSNAASQRDAQIETAEPDQASVEKAFKASKAAKGKGKAPIMTPANLDKTGKDDGEDYGKQIGGNATNFPREIASVTHKNEGSQILKGEPMTQVPSTGPGASNALSPEAVTADVVDRQVDPPHVVSPSSSAKPSNTQAPSKKNRPVPAVPNLNLHPSIPSAHGKGSQLSAIGVSTALSLTATATVPIASEKDNPQSTNPPDASSVASSTTLQPDGSTNVSPSPTHSVFRTALQTPVTPALPRTDSPEAEDAQTDAPREEAPKKKKKKSKKKSKKSAIAPTEIGRNSQSAGPTEAGQAADADAASVLGVANSDSGSGNDDDYDLYDPFSSQLSHIEAIRRGLKNPNSYYAQVNKEMEAEKDAAEAHASKAKKLSDSSLLRQIEGYMKENPLRFMTAGKKASQNDMD